MHRIGLPILYHKCNFFLAIIINIFFWQKILDKIKFYENIFAIYITYGVGCVAPYKVVVYKMLICL